MNLIMVNYRNVGEELPLGAWATQEWLCHSRKCLLLGNYDTLRMTEHQKSQGFKRTTLVTCLENRYPWHHLYLGAWLVLSVSREAPPQIFILPLILLVPKPQAFRDISPGTKLSASKGHWNKSGPSRPHGKLHPQDEEAEAQRLLNTWIALLEALRMEKEDVESGRMGLGWVAEKLGRGCQEVSIVHPGTSCPEERKMKLPTEIYIWDFQVFRGECRKDTFIERWQIPSLQIY